MFELLPTNGLDRSILTPVLIGLAYTTFFTETLGWSFVALVIPGYLSAVFITAPWSAVSIVAEAVVTYAVAHALGRGLPKYGPWLTFFGRERFFLLIAVSVVVRLLSEGFVLPAIAGATELVHASALYSIGLVMVPLTANACWNVGFRRGVFCTGSLTVLTWVTIELVAIPLTNLDLTQFELTYESVAVDFLQAPKAYLLLLCGAAFGAAANLKYGWDFGGILVPALLALAWYSPLKLASTLIEAFVVVLITRSLLRLPLISSMVFEGPRRVLLVYVVGFTLKVVIGHVAGAVAPGFQVTELYGFGYVLPSLIAVKVWQKDSVARVLVPAAVVSAAGFLAGNMVGYGFALAMSPSAPPPASPEESPAPAEWEMVLAASWSQTDEVRARTPSNASVRELTKMDRGEPEPPLLQALSSASQAWLIQPASSSLPAIALRTSGHDDYLVVAGPSTDPIFALAIPIAEAAGLGAIVALPSGGPLETETWIAAVEGATGADVPLAIVADGERLRTLRFELDGDQHALRQMLRMDRADWRASAAQSLGGAPPLVDSDLPTLLDRRRIEVDGALASESRSPGALRAYRQRLAPAMLEQNLDDAYVRVVARMLGLKGMRLSEGGVALVSDAPGGLLWVHREGRALAVVAPFVTRHRGMLEAAVYTFMEGNASDLIAGDNVGPYHPDRGRESLELRSLAQRTFETLVLDDAYTAVVHRAVPPHHELYGLDLIVSDGTAVSDPRVAHPMVRSVMAGAWDDISGGAFYSGDRVLHPFRGAGDPMLAFGRRFARGRTAIAWWSSRLRSVLYHSPPWVGP